MYRPITPLIILALLTPCLAFASPARLSQGMVVSESKIASQVGADILRAGGNAIDAAVAVGYALAVVNPCCGNIGGGGFMLIRQANGKTTFLNFREKAPLKASKHMFASKGTTAATNGYLAVGVPGTVLGLEAALKQYGTMTRTQVMAPAIRIAQEGYLITPYEAEQIADHANTFQQQPNVAAIYMPQDKPLSAGSRLTQPNLAASLTLIAQQGSDVFYKGSIAHTIVKASEQHGGILSMQDFARYTVKESKPIECTYRGYTILSSPPPSSGGVTLCEILNILEYFPLNAYGYQTTTSTKTLIEAMRYGFIDRNTQLGDPDFVTNPIQQLLSKTYAKTLSEKIQSNSFNPVTTHALEAKELTDTTHYSVVDKAGNAVSVTYTLNGFFGAGVMAGNTGFFLNNEMDDFATRIGEANKFGLVQQEMNAIAPGKRPLSSMTPTIVLKDGKVVMVLGSPGGPRIITTVLLTLINLIDYHMPLQEAVNAPRFHYQDQPDLIDHEPFAFPFFTKRQFEHWGYHFAAPNRWGASESILIDPITRQVAGANDIRRPDGAAIAAP